MTSLATCLFRCRCPSRSPLGLGLSPVGILSDTQLEAAHRLVANMDGDGNLSYVCVCSRFLDM